MKILNLTQHAATPEQVEAGVVDLPEADRAELCNLLTFDRLPDRWAVRERAEAISDLAVKVARSDYVDGSLEDVEWVMIGGAPFLMSRLEDALRDRGWVPVYAFSRRDSVEQAQPDGSVRKVNVFRHAGFVEA